MRSPAEKAASPSCAPDRGQGFALISWCVLKFSTETILAPDSREPLCFWTLSRAVLHALRWQQNIKEQLIQLADGKTSSRHFLGLETSQKCKYSIRIPLSLFPKQVYNWWRCAVELHCGAAPRSYMVADSTSKCCPVQDPEGSVLQGVVFELERLLFAIQWISGLQVWLLCEGTTWWQQLCSGYSPWGNGTVAVLPGRLASLSESFYRQLKLTIIWQLISKFLKRDFYFPENWNILSSFHWIICSCWR